MFRGKIKANVIRDAMNIVSNVVEEAKLRVTSSGISLRAVDSSHVAMVELVIKGGAFDEFKATESDIAINIDRLEDVLKLASPDDIVSMFHDEEKNRLIVTIQNVTRRMALLDAAAISDPKIKNLNFSAKVTLRTADLLQGVKASEALSDHITIVVTHEDFELYAEGEGESANLKLAKGLLLGLECKESVKSLYPIDEFSKMARASGLSESVTLNLGNAYPVEMEFPLAGGEGHVRFLLAPRIEND